MSIHGYHLVLQNSENLKDHPIDYSTGVIIVVDNNYSKVVFGEKLEGFNSFEALNDAPEAYNFYRFIFTSHQIF